MPFLFNEKLNFMVIETGWEEVKASSSPEHHLFSSILPLSFQISKDPIFVPGVWGPYFSAMVPGFWLNEGGQSVTGKLVS